MKICYLCPDPGIPLDGAKGAAAHVRGVVSAMLALGHDVHVLTGAAFAGSALRIRAQRIAAPRIVEAIADDVSPRMARALRHLWMGVAVEQALTDAIDTFQPDLIYERYSPFSAAGSLVARERGVHHVLEVNAPLAWEGSRFRRQALAEAADELERAAFAATRLILTVSDELRDWLIDAGVDGAKIITLPNGVDAASFSPRGLRRRCADDDAIVLGFVGSLKPWHGMDLLAAAFTELAADPRFHLLIVGDGPLAPVVRSLREAFPGRVTWTGAIPHEDVPDYVRGMDIGLAPYPATDEFYFSPLKVLEYMAAGVPVVASAIGQVPELVRHGVTGVLVPPGDPDALVAAIRALAADEPGRTALGRAAAADVARHHTWEHRLEQLLQRMLPSRPPTPLVEEGVCSP